MDDVLEGIDGWLFLSGGSNHVLRLYQEPGFFSGTMETDWVSLLLMREEKLKTYGARYRHVIAPDKISVFPGLTGLDFPLIGSAPPLARLSTNPSDHRHLLCDPTKELATDTKGRPTYFKTDSHWTIFGAHAAYCVLCNSLGLDQSCLVSLDGRPYARWEVLFDLGSKVSPQVKEDTIFTPLPPSVERSYANEIVELREASDAAGIATVPHHGCHVVYINSSPKTDSKIVLFGDSFSDYRPSTFTALIAETFRETHFIWSTSIDYGYVERVKPDFVVTEIAERFMTQVPLDDLDIRSYTAEAISKWKSQSYAGPGAALT